PSTSQARHSFPTRRSSDLNSAVIFLDTGMATLHERCAGAGPSCAQTTERSLGTNTTSRQRIWRSERTPGQADRLIAPDQGAPARSEEHTSELQSRENLVCR